MVWWPQRVCQSGFHDQPEPGPVQPCPGRYARRPTARGSDCRRGSSCAVAIHDLELSAATPRAARPSSLIFLNWCFFTVQGVSEELAGAVSPLLRTLWASRLRLMQAFQLTPNQTSRCSFRAEVHAVLLLSPGLGVRTAWTPGCAGSSLCCGVQLRYSQLDSKDWRKAGSSAKNHSYKMISPILTSITCYHCPH